MFELETAIENWKEAFSKNEAVSTEKISELEAHLRDVIIDLRKSGLSQREAFILGADRLGHPSELAREFAKINVGALWRRRIYWMLAGYISITVAGSLVSAMVTITGTGMAIIGVGGTVAGMLMVAVMVLGWIGLAFVAYRQFQNIGDRGEYLPIKWLVATSLILIVAPIITWAGRVVQMRIVEPTWYGESVLFLGLGGFVIQICVVASCLIAMCMFNKAVVKVVD